MESPTLGQIEFDRAALGLVWSGDEWGRKKGLPPWTIHIESARGRGTRSCSCQRSGTCAHLKEISRAARELRQAYGGRSWQEVFEESIWYRLAKLLFEGQPQSCAAATAQRGAGSNGALEIRSPDGQTLVRYLDRETADLFLERTAPGVDPEDHRGCAGLLHRLARLQETPLERQLRARGGRSLRRAWQESVWHRLAYHCLREAGPERGVFRPRFDQQGGELAVLFAKEDGTPLVELLPAPDRALQVFRALGEAFPDQADLALYPVPFEEVFLLSRCADDGYSVEPAIRVPPAGSGGGAANCPERLVSGAGLSELRHGRLLYLPELDVKGEIAHPEKGLRLPAPARLTADEVPAFLEQHRAEVERGVVLPDETLRRREIYRGYDSITLTAEPTAEVEASDALGRSWYWLSAHYGFGGHSVKLREILLAKRLGRRYLETPGGWVDLSSPPLQRLNGLFEQTDPEGGEHGRLRLSARELLLLRAITDRSVEIVDAEAHTPTLKRLFELQPAAPFSQPAGLASPLRPYQTLGVDWLRFLWENRLGGLLCDDMGLGKTHQAMALMVALVEQAGVVAPFLVVCPTTVISHWRNKIRDHAPGLRAHIHHGPDRQALADLGPGAVVLTSYGLLRRDIEELQQVEFALAVFDEIQYLKNRETQSHRAARRLRAAAVIGLTGTPIENTVLELKALFDLALPGYLGSDEAFERRFGWISQPGQAKEDRLPELRRLVAPFLLRRLKGDVLDELPEKIVDLRTCALSTDQLEQYRSVIERRAGGLVSRLALADETLSYIHIFAVLNLLKQICDHPALVLGRIEEAERYQSGKWDLYRELLQESLDSGQKVVVFSQYLGMIELMSRHLESLGIGHVTLTGGTQKRGEVIERFNSDPDCRVFVGSLKAGGTGIDLVGASVVIHYDRWWNAAREDQATDRVHRIGQRRAVQVFKLITEGTLEEKIHAIIERKRQLMASVVEEDHPGLAKVFSRQELVDLLQFPLVL